MGGPRRGGTHLEELAERRDGSDGWWETQNRSPETLRKRRAFSGQWLSKDSDACGCCLPLTGGYPLIAMPTVSISDKQTLQRGGTDYWPSSYSIYVG